MNMPLLQVRNLVKRYRLPRTSLFRSAPHRTALDGISFDLDPGETLGIVGESGSGKSTMGRLVAGLERPDSGEILRANDCRMQMVFQDPYGSLDPRQRIETIIAEPLHSMRLNSAERRDRAARALDEVGIGRAALGRYPHQFSGGQRQRIAIARALIAEPNLLCADEPVSALDVSVQAQVLNLLSDICSRRSLTLILISHDLSVVAHMCDRVAIMRRGRIVETGATREVLRHPRNPYTRQLRDAVLPPDPVPARRLLGR